MLKCGVNLYGCINEIKEGALIIDDAYFCLDLDYYGDLEALEEAMQEAARDRPQNLRICTAAKNRLKNDRTWVVKRKNH